MPARRVSQGPGASPCAGTSLPVSSCARAGRCRAPLSYCRPPPPLGASASSHRRPWCAERPQAGADALAASFGWVTGLPLSVGCRVVTGPFTPRARRRWRWVGPQPRGRLGEAPAHPRPAAGLAPGVPPCGSPTAGLPLAARGPTRGLSPSPAAPPLCRRAVRANARQRARFLTYHLRRCCSKAGCSTPALFIRANARQSCTLFFVPLHALQPQRGVQPSSLCIRRGSKVGCGPPVFSLPVRTRGRASSGPGALGRGIPRRGAPHSG